MIVTDRNYHAISSILLLDHQVPVLTGVKRQTLSNMNTDRHYYYLDASINEHFQEIFESAQALAARALQRLNNPLDSGFANIFERIFKTPVTDTEQMKRSPEFQRSAQDVWNEKLGLHTVLNHVRRDLHSFAFCWSRTQNRARAEVRIHADGLGRYVQHGPKAFFDPVNYMFRFRSRANIERDWSEPYATVMFERPEDPRLNPEGQHPRRNVIDFTESAREIPTQISWETVVGDSLIGGHMLLQTTLIHEMMHCDAYRLLDFPDAWGATCGWTMVSGLTKEQSYLCAESIALLCLVAARPDF